MTAPLTLKGKIILGGAAAVALVVILLLVVTSSGGLGDQAHAIDTIIAKQGPTQLTANLRADHVAGTVTMGPVNCVQTAGTQQYTCLSSYTVSIPSLGVTDKKYMIDINATCDSSGNCQWHTTGPGRPVG